MINFNSLFSKWTLLPFAILFLLLITSCSSSVATTSKTSVSNAPSTLTESVVQESEQKPEEGAENEEVVVNVHASYQLVPPNKRMNTAALVVQGVIKEISETSYNSDDGQPWDHKEDELILSLHTITISVEDSLKGEKVAGDDVDVTILGLSPLDKYATDIDHDLQVGQNVIVYINDTELNWKNNETRPKYMFISSPDASYKVQQADGLYHAVHGDEAPQSLEEIKAESRQK